MVTVSKIFKCLICNIEFKSNAPLGIHLKNSHSISSKDYYLKFIDENAGKCICGNATAWRGPGAGFLEFCSRLCAARSEKKTSAVKKWHAENSWVDKRRQKLQEKYGVINVFQLQHVQNKKSATVLERYGVDNSSRILGFGIKQQRTMRATMLERYGVEHSLQVPEFHKKFVSSSFSRKDVIVGERCFTVQGWEHLFLRDIDLFSFSLDDITTSAPAIKYNFNSKSHVYHPDFFARSVNTVIEVKSTWTYWGNGKIGTYNHVCAKLSGAFNAGHEVLCVVYADEISQPTIKWMKHEQ